MISVKQMEEGFNQSNKVFVDFIKGNSQDKDMAKLAIAYISSAIRMKSADNNEKSLALVYYNRILEDKKELQKYIETTYPDMSMKKALSKGKK